MKLKVLVLGSILTLAGCAQTSIFPTGHNSYASVSTSSSQGPAEKDAREKAEAQCRLRGKRLIVTQHQTQYKGADTATKIAGGVVSALVGGPNMAVSSDDYEVKMRFKCV